MGPAPRCHFVPRLPNGSPKIPTTRIPATLRAHNFACKPPIEMRSKAKLYPLSRDFQHYVAHHLHAKKSRWFPTFNGQQSNCNLTPNPSYGHKLCLTCPNGSCEPILNIYVPKYFQWYKKKFNPLGFDPCNYSLKIWESTGTPIPKVGVHLGVWRFIPSHSPTLLGTWDVTPGLPSWLAPLQALTLVVSLRLGLWQVVTHATSYYVLVRGVVLYP